MPAGNNRPRVASLAWASTEQAPAVVREASVEAVLATDIVLGMEEVPVRKSVSECVFTTESELD